MTMNKENGKIGILVGGGPASGINGVIHAATIEAINNGLEVIGIYDGFKHLMEGKVVGVPLTIANVSRIHLDGGSILRTSRAIRQDHRSAAQLRLRAGGGRDLGTGRHRRR